MLNFVSVSKYLWAQRCNPSTKSSADHKVLHPSGPTWYALYIATLLQGRKAFWQY